MTPKETLAAVVGFIVCFACSSATASGGTGGSPAANGGATTSGGSGGLGGATGGGESVPCNYISLRAPAVTITYDPNPAPQAVGGTITNGTYFLTAEIVYDTASGPADVLDSQLEISGTTWQGVDRFSSGEFHFTEEVSVTGTTLSFYLGCPGSSDDSVVFSSGEFSVDASGFTIYNNSVSAMYTKQ